MKPYNNNLKQNEDGGVNGIIEIEKKLIESTCENIIKINYRHGKQTASLDRIDSNKGYVEGNVRWIHKKINQIKMDMTDFDFLLWIDKIYDFTHLGK